MSKNTYLCPTSPHIKHFPCFKGAEQSRAKCPKNKNKIKPNLKLEFVQGYQVDQYKSFPIRLSISSK